MSEDKTKKQDVHWGNLYKLFHDNPKGLSVREIAEIMKVELDNKDLHHAIEIMERRPDVSVMVGRDSKGHIGKIFCMKMENLRRRDLVFKDKKEDE
jgi:hypothetical protein